MNRWHFLMILLALPAVMLPRDAASQYPNRQASPPYQPAVPAPSSSNYYGGWGGYSGGGTVAGNAMNGMANVISAQGQRNLSNSAAAVNMTQATKNHIQNRQQWTNTYFDMQKTNKAAFDASVGPPVATEQLARMAKYGIPKPLATSQADAVSGQLFWPSALQQECFAAQRGDVDQLVATQARYGGLSYEDQMKARKAILDMFTQLKAQVDQIPPQDYTTCRSFLSSVLYATTKTLL